MAVQKVDVLIVDDDKNICDILTNYCKGLDLFKNIVVAQDGVMASLKLQNQSFGLIILDLNLPKKSGLDVLRDLAPKKGTDIKNRPEDILVISGALDRTVLTNVAQQGVKNFLAKPFDEAAFKNKVTMMFLPKVW